MGIKGVKDEPPTEPEPKEGAEPIVEIEAKGEPSKLEAMMDRIKKQKANIKGSIF